MNQYPALPQEFRLAIAWLEQDGNKVNVLTYDGPTHTVNVEIQSSLRAPFVQWVLLVDEDDNLVKRKLPGKIGKGLVIRNPHLVSSKQSDETMQRAVKRINRRRRPQDGKLTEHCPYTQDVMDKWKERADAIRQVQAAEGRFLRAPTDANFQACKTMRDYVGFIEDQLVAMEEERMEDEAGAAAAS